MIIAMVIRVSFWQEKQSVRSALTGAVRAEGLGSEYANKARRLDARYCGCGRGEVGPVESKLRTYGQVRGLVFGAWGEAFPDGHDLLTAAAELGARRHCAHMAARTEAAATACLP